MCALVTVMCVTLVLLGTVGRAVTGPVASQTEQPVQDKTVCVQKCSLRCRQWLARQKTLTCCDCDSLCDAVCGPNLEITPSNRESPITITPSPAGSTESLCHSGLCGSTLRRRQRSPPLREVSLIARSVGLDLGGSARGGISWEEGQKDTTQVIKNFRLVSMSGDMGKDIAAVNVTWEPSSRKEDSPWYLISWDTEGGGLRGNLLTNNTSASLTLGSNAVYHVQVSSVSAGDSSECLVVDTHISSSQPVHTLASPERTAGAVAAILVFLVASLLLTTKCHWPSKHIEPLPDCSHFKVYPPPITLPLNSPESSLPSLQPV